MPHQIYFQVYQYESDEGCNTYYIDDDRKILIDAGTPIDKPVDIIILTHCHFDHLLYLAELQKKNNCKVFCSVKDKEAIETLSEKSLARFSPKPLNPVKIDKTLKEGDIIKTNNFSLQVLETPGHTDGSICLYDKEKGILFSGDTYFGNAVGRTDFPSGSSTDMESSLKRIQSLKPKIICAGHETG